MEKQNSVKIHKIDANGKILGRLATEVADLLRGKGKVSFVYYKNSGDRVEVYNLAKIKVTGNKLENKRYYRHSQHPGALKEISLKDLMAKNPCIPFKKAVKGMLPNNKLQKEWLINLKLVSGPETSKEQNGK